MAKILNMYFLVALLFLATLFESSVANTNHTVGDSTGWRIPSGGASTYGIWASHQTFVVGDVLVFNYAAGTHDVTKVTKTEFDGCTTSNSISTTTSAPAMIPLSSAGEYYFICSFSGHCNAGQKLFVNISASPITTPPPVTTPPPAGITSPPSPPSPFIIVPAPPPHSSAISLSAMPSLVAIFSIVVAFFYLS